MTRQATAIDITLCANCECVHIRLADAEGPIGEAALPPDAANEVARQIRELVQRKGAALQ